jgi:hypothetical protein
VAMAMRGEEPGQAHQDSTAGSATSQPAAVSFPYPLDVTARGGVIPIPTGHLHRLWREAGLDGGSGVADARGTTDHALLQRMREGVPG